tara:strand:+ start:287 stop:1228 length:942 start_codon:yes stop_codon:yes gene_type:complete
MDKKKKIFLAGHRGLVGNAILEELKFKGYNNIMLRSKKQLNLTNQNKVNNFFKRNKIDFVIIAAAKVGGIFANQKNPSEFIYENLMIVSNIIHAAHQNNINDILILGSSCIYPKHCKQPIKEKYLLTGSLEQTNQPYALAKIAGLEMCKSYNSQHNRNYRCLMPPNLYGGNDNFDLKTSHFYPAIIRKLFDAKLAKKDLIKLWGTGKVKREIMYVKDLANSVVYFLETNTSDDLINVGTESDKTVKEYAEFLRKIIYPKCKIIFNNNTKIDGTPRKLLDSSIAKKYGWKSNTTLLEGTLETIKIYKKRFKIYD